jgi:colanic acid biosynthesis glycosyl transferase WcaI
MRLLIHGINYTPEVVGIGRYTGELGSWLAAQGHAVTVLTAPPYYPQWRVPADYRWPAWRREYLDGVEVLRAPLYVPSRPSGKTRVLHELSFGASCLRWWPELLARQWDAVLAVCPLLQSGIIPALLAGRRGLPLVMHVQDLQIDAARELGIIRHPLILAGAERLERWLFRRAAAVTTISEAMAQRVRRKGVAAARVQVLPNWADLEAISPGQRDNGFRRAAGLTDETVILYAGNLGEKQGLEIMLEAAALTRARRDLSYLLVGEGAAKARLLAQARALALDNVRFLPIQPASRFPAMLAAADIHLVVQKKGASDLVMPSKLSNILAAGRPFVATATPESELGRVTRRSRAGVLAPPEDSPCLAQAILELAGTAEGRQAMGLRGRRYAETWLARSRIMLQWEQLLSALVADYNAARAEVVSRARPEPEE